MTNSSRLFHAAIISAVLVAIVTGFWVVGSPAEQRAKRLDDQRVNDLQSISSAIEQYYNLNGRHQLPPTLAALRTEPNMYVSSMTDPKTGQEYPYYPTVGGAYQLCATFETDTTGEASGTKPVPMRPVSGSNVPSIWIHGTGITCSDYSVNIWPTPAAPVTNP